MSLMTDPNAKICNKYTRSHRSKREKPTKKCSENLPCKLASMELQMNRLHKISENMMKIFKATKHKTFV